jgi:hypothetical protein
MISRLNHARIKGIVEILINPTLYFIKQILDENASMD